MIFEEVLNFWFKECSPKQWFTKDDAFDTDLKARFLETYWQVVKGETESWRFEPQGRLTEIIILDQFSRNMFRGTPQAFLYDPLALALSQEAVRNGADEKLSKQERHFLYMPYMHSESKMVHEKAIELFGKLGGDDAVKYEKEHKEIIDRFGRYPHRNAILGRESTPEEEEFIKTDKGF